jgi:hypothetical protein
MQYEFARWVRAILSLAFVVCLLSAATVIAARSAQQRPEALLRDQLGLTESEISQARDGHPVAKLLPNGTQDELALVGVVRLKGDPARLSGWIRSIDQFRAAAELGTARVLPSPVTPDAFSVITLDAAERDTLRRCTADSCALRVPAATLGRLQSEVRWGSVGEADQANAIFREMLAEFAAAYAKGGSQALRSYARGAAAPDLGELLSRAAVFKNIAPELVIYLQQFPSGTLAGVDQRLYVSTITADDRVVSLHHLVVFQRAPGETFIVDRTIYASRYFDSAAAVVSLLTDPSGGFYAVAGGRIVTSQLGSAAAKLLRRRVEKSALESVRMYLEWMRDSLALSPAA